MNWMRITLVLAVTLAFPAHAFAVEPETDTEAMPAAYELAKQAVEKKDWKKAARLFRQAISDEPRNHNAYNMYGYTLRHLGKFKEAISAYNTALKLKPDNPEALQYRGIAHLKAGDRDAAQRDYLALVRLGSPLADSLKKGLVTGAVNTW